jgi:hypothetical protein
VTGAQKDNTDKQTGYLERKYEIKNLFKLTGLCMYRQFNTQQLSVLPTQCIYVFCVDVRTNSDYFPMKNVQALFLTNAPRFPKQQIFLEGSQNFPLSTNFPYTHTQSQSLRSYENT